MSTLESLFRLMGKNPALLLSQEEIILLESDLNLRIRDQLQEFFKEQYRDYFITIHLNTEKENDMLEGRLLCLIVQDIISTGEYTLEGIARYTNTHQEVIEDLLLGKNQDPSSTLFHKTIELHITIRRDLYISIIKKIISRYLEIIQQPPLS